MTELWFAACFPPDPGMLQHRAPQLRCAAVTKTQGCRLVRVKTASTPQQQTAALQSSDSAEYETLKGLKVVSAVDGFEVDLLSLWQVNMAYCGV